MTLLFFKSLFLLTILVISLITGLMPFYAKLHQKRLPSVEVGEALAGGVFLGAALFHMLPSAEAAFRVLLGDAAYPYANLFCALGFVTLLFLERIVIHFTQGHFDLGKKAIVYVLVIVLSVHAITEGLALGINTHFETSLIIFIAIVVHKGAESFALASYLRKSHMLRRKVITIFLIFSLMTPTSIAIGSWFTTLLTTNSGKLLEAVFNSCAAGTFLYIATLHQISHQHAHTETIHLKEFLALAFGLTLMAVVAIWI